MRLNIPRTRAHNMMGMPTDTDFDTANLTRIEALLLAHRVGRNYFQGQLYDAYGQRLVSLVIDRPGDAPLTLNETTIGRLFMIPDGSVVSARRVNAASDAPAGLRIESSSVFHLDGEQSSVIVFREMVGSALWIDALHIQSLILAAPAPARLATVAFGLMAINAYRLGFKQINLMAAGRGPLSWHDPNTMVGYAVWPKFGFDAPVEQVELDRFPQPGLSRARTVQDVRRAMPGWWEQHGSDRTMEFDLTANSRSWSILLHYLYNALQEDAS
jgi:hypothetical protein